MNRRDAVLVSQRSGNGDGTPLLGADMRCLELHGGHSPVNIVPPGFVIVAACNEAKQTYANT